MTNLRVTIVQANLIWESPEENMSHIQDLLEAHELETDIIILPEMFTTGFSMNPSALAEENGGMSHQWMIDLSKRYDAAVTGSLIITENGKYFNRLFWVEPDGDWTSYDKRHLFSFATEDKYYTAGTKRVIVEFRGWRICPLVCYDLRFPVWSRNADLLGLAPDHVYDMVIYVANWPAVRDLPWRAMLEARAHENQAYCIGVNRVGSDGSEMDYIGNSTIVSPKGEILHQKAELEHVFTQELSLQELQSFREKFPTWEDKDRFKLIH